MKRIRSLAVVFALALYSQILPCFGQGTVFSYQGRLNDAGSPANGTNYGMVFYLYDAATNGALLGSLGIASVSVSNGLFTLPLNFGNVFNGDPRWLEITVQKNGGGFTTLAPRQPISPAPYAIFANTASNVSGTVSGSQISGAIPLTGLPPGVITNGASGVNISGTFTGNGAGITNINLLNVNSSGLISIATNQANFGTAATVNVGPFPTFVTIADMNNDGRPDIIAANYGDLTVSIITNAGNGRFAVSSTPLAGMFYVTTNDVNNDGKMDLVGVTAGSRVSILTNNGAGGFPNITQIVVGPTPHCLVPIDVNLDGKMDLVTANYEMNALVVLTNNGSGTFTIATTNATGGNPWFVTKADVNNDGKIELISANVLTNTLSVLTNNGNNGFGVSATYSVGASPLCVLAVDVNGDNKVDLVTANANGGSLTVLTNNGNGIFVLASSPAVSGQPYSVTAADVTGDGKPDLICVDYTASFLNVLVNNGNGNFTLAASPPTGYQPYSVISADLNGDGRPDVVSANAGNATVTILTNTISSSIVFSSPISGSAANLYGVNPNAILNGLTTNIVVTTPSGSRTFYFNNGVLRYVQ
jgi:hypothetical protein